MQNKASRVAFFRLIPVLFLALSACLPAGPPSGEGDASPDAGGETQAESTEELEPEATEPADSGPDAGEPEQLDTVRVVILPFLSFAPFYIAIEEGYFAEQGIEVELVNLVQQQEILPALASGQVDVSSGLVSAGIINAIAGGGEMRIVANKGYIDPDGCSSIALLASATFLENNDPTDPESLRGQEIDVVRSTWIEYFLDNLLQTVGLTLDDVVATDLPSTSEIEAMNTGALNLNTQNEPWVTRIIAAGHSPILDPVTTVLPDSESAVMIYGPTLLADEDLGNRFMIAYLQGVRQYEVGKTDRNVEILTAAVNEEEDFLRAMCWQAIRPNGTANTASLLDFQDWAVERGYVENPVALDQIWDPSYVDHAVGVLGAQE